MFERRLKIFLLFLVLATIVLLSRAVQVQVVDQSYWTQRAAGLLQNTQTTETTRGRILDLNGKVLAVDVPCTDACVDYRAILNPPNPKWVADVVKGRLSSRLGSQFRKMSATQRTALRATETRQVLADLETMWQTLAELYQPTDDQETDHRAAIEEIRRSIVQRVEMRRRWVWFHNFQRDQAKIADAPEWRKWLSGGSGDGPDIDSFDVKVDEQTQPHVILPALDQQTCNFLGTRLNQFPGLVLSPSKHRLYPMKETACHILGRLSRVSAEDLARAKSDQLDETRMYLPNDQIGREGIEALCEPLLRGARGMIERRVGDDAIVEQKDFVPGQDVRLTIDADLQTEVQQMLKHIRQKKANGEWATPPPGMDMHGAAVVIDVKTGEVRALASNPGFDLNEFNDNYAALVSDKLNNPLVDRATCDEFEPGSTVKPMVGLGAITQGVLKPLEGIECTGYLVLNVNGRKVRQSTGRCWVVSEFGEEWLRNHGIFTVAHHPIPFPHKGHDGNPDGWLTYSDALERSCNVFFETVADRLGPAGMAHWYDAFGFGRPTGIGITERRGLRPGQRPVDMVMARMANCITGIGQGQVWATPLQIANEAATVARGGIWMRPHLLTSGTQARLDAVRPRPADMPPDEVNLHLDPEGLRQAKIGMVAVVNGDSGTGTAARRNDMLVAGKTGTAQAARIWQRLVDQSGNVIREPLPPANNAHPNTGTEWYRSTDDDGKSVVHAWFMGFAPSEKPEIAFCVLIEYCGAGGGGGVAGPVVSNILEACVKHGYLHPPAYVPPIALAQ
jgi:penicillin-binding protein 2